MASIPFPGPWSSNSQFTNSAQYLLSSTGVIWLVGNSVGSTAAIFSSTDQGISFQALITIPSVGGPELGFDPAVAMDANDVLHIVGQVAMPDGVTLTKFTYDTIHGTLGAPVNLTQAGIVGSDYDIVALANGNTYVAASLLTRLVESVQGFEIDPNGNIVSTDALEPTQPFTAGNRYGSLALWTPDGATVEVYLCYEPKAFTFSDTTIAIAQIIRSGHGSIAPSVQLTTVTGRYASDNLVILGDSRGRYLMLGYYTQQKASLIGNLLLGYLPKGGSNWSFKTVFGTPASSLVQAVLLTSPSGLVLGALNANLANVTSPSPVVLFDLDVQTWTLSPRADFTYPALANWLRATSSSLPATMQWGVVTESADGTARFYTGYNAAPVVVLTPASETAQRNQVYMLDARGSYDPNLDPMRFSWSISDPTGAAVLTPVGATATVTLPAAAGPGAITLVITVQVVDLDRNNNPRHAPVSAAATLHYPAIASPSIEPWTTPTVGRNIPFTVSARVVGSPFVSLTYTWVQTSGTTVPILSGATSNSLTVQTEGVLISGETLTFTLTVSDGVNAPVSAPFSIAVAARTHGAPVTVITGSNDGTIAQRNTGAGWGITSQAPLLSPVSFAKTRRAPLVAPFVTPTIDFRLGFLPPAGLTLNGSTKPHLNGLRLLDETLRRAASVWSSHKVDVTQFRTSFTFQFAPGDVADGFTFALQGQGPTAIGMGGGALGWAGIAPSVAVKFDIYNNTGEGTNSTGVYLDGAALSPLIPATNITGVRLTSGNLIRCDLAFTSGVLLMALFDHTTGAEFHTSFNVDIPGRVGNTAYVGFTGGTGGGGCQLDILSWEFTSTSTLSAANLQNGSVMIFGPQSVMVARNGESWNVYTPNPNDTILDAVHEYVDQTILLTGSQKLLRYLPTQPATDTDNVNAAIDLTALTTMTFTGMAASCPAGGLRVIAVYGPQGCLLLEVDTTFRVTRLLALDDRYLYGALNVDFIRLSNVEHLNSGKVLVATTDGTHDYETEFDLHNRSVLGVWDELDIKNQHVLTGEILFEQPDTYGGQPQPPVITSATAVNGGILVSWSQGRPDLVTGYTLSMLRSIPLYATGVDSSRVAQRNGAVDWHYTLTGSSDQSTPGPELYVVNPPPPNLIQTSSFANGIGIWADSAGWPVSAVPVVGQSFGAALKVRGRDTYETTNVWTVTAGQTYNVSAWVNTLNLVGHPVDSGGWTVGLGLELSKVQGFPGGSVIWLRATNVASGQGWTYVSGSVTIPAGYVYARPWFQIDLSPPDASASYYALFALPGITQPALLTAPAGVNWISPSLSTLLPQGTYTLQTAFDLSQHNSARAVVIGTVSATGPVALSLNGNPVALSATGDFIVTQGLLPGGNALAITLTHGGGPCGVMLRASGWAWMLTKQAIASGEVMEALVAAYPGNDWGFSVVTHSEEGDSLPSSLVTVQI